MKENMKLLGCKVVDVVTGLTGIVTSIAFDLYGCVQAIIDPGLDKDNKLPERHWFDLKRLRVLDATPVMTVPTFEFVPGGQEKPAQKSQPLP